MEQNNPGSRAMHPEIIDCAGRRIDSPHFRTLPPNRLVISVGSSPSQFTQKSTINLLYYGNKT